MNGLQASLPITFDTYKFDNVTLTAKRLIELTIPKHEYWGESVSVNEVDEPIQLDNRNYRLGLQILSGDTIIFEAKSIHVHTGSVMQRVVGGMLLRRKI